VLQGKSCENYLRIYTEIIQDIATFALLTGVNLNSDKQCKIVVNRAYARYAS